MAKNRRLGITQPSKSNREKANEQFEKERASRAKCRANITNTDLCLDCSQSAICSSEATQDWLSNKDNTDSE